MLNRKILIIIGLFILIFFGVILRLSLKPKPQLAPPKSQTPTISQPTQELQQKQKPETIDTSNWKTYRNEKYGFEVRYPAYAIMVEKENIPPEDRVLEPFGLFDFKFTDSTGKDVSSIISLRFGIYDLKKYKTFNYYFETIAYNKNQKYWYEVKSLKPVIEEYMKEKFRNWPEDFVKNYRGIPRIFMKTDQEIPIYENFVYSDVGESTVEYILINEEKEIAIVFLKNFSSNSYDFSPESVKEFVVKIEGDILEILRSFIFF